MNSKVIWIIFAALFVLHQDVWNWDSQTLVFGFIPMSLAYHAGFSLAAVTLWALAIKYAWPSDVEAWADELDGDISNTDPAPGPGAASTQTGAGR